MNHSARGRFAAAVSLAVAGAMVACGDGPPQDLPSTADVLSARAAGEAFLLQDRLDEAEAEFRRLVELAPREAVGYSLLARLELRRGDVGRAARWIDEALEREPEGVEHHRVSAAVASVRGDTGVAREQLERALELSPDEPRTLWSLAALSPPTERIELLARVVEAVPGNPAARLALAEALLRDARADSATGTLERFRQVAPVPPPGAAGPLEEAVSAARDGAAASALVALDRFRRRFEVSGPYQAGISELETPPGPIVGLAELHFSHEFSLRVQEDSAVLAALHFTDATEASGLASILAPGSGPGVGPSFTRAGDFDGDGDEDLVVSGSDGLRWFRVDLGAFVDVTAERAARRPAEVQDAVFADMNNDGYLDLLLSGVDGVELLTSDGAGRFEPSLVAGAERAPPGRLVAADLDLDGDLDVLLGARGGARLFRNDGDGSYSERTSEAGLGPAGGVSDLALADFDDDRDLDFVTAGPSGLVWWSNARGGSFVSTVVDDRPMTAVLADDLDNDGWVDLVAATAEGGLVRLAGAGGGGFAERIPLPIEGRVTDLATLVFDNDGHLDLAVAEEGRLRLLRADGRGDFTDGSSFLPADPTGSSPTLRLQPLAYNDDGDPDLVVTTAAGGVRLLRNDGGSAHHYLELDLTGLGTGSGKNNRFAIGARVEVRAGELFQVRTVTSPGVHFGLNGHLKADVVRVKWPNGVVQDLFFPGTDQDLIEQQQLKGSCPLLYAWNGESFEFVTDVMWRSALGMPLGILGGTGRRTFAPAFPSQEYVRLPPGTLVAREGDYWIQLTEELWETIYIDEVELLAVDHPDSIEIRVDEGFEPPAPGRLELLALRDRRRPVSATDGRGRDVIGRLAAADFDYVDALAPGRYQGIVEPHELVLDLGRAATAPGPLTLYLTGWVFPTDASINVALAQSDAERADFPVLDVRDADGAWRPAASVSIPSGKQKTVAVDLTNAFPTDDRQVRIRTNLQIYWDEAFFSAGSPNPLVGEARVSRLAPASADLHYRGFSRTFRRGGRYGPHWFDYQTVSTEPRWSDLAGRYTRYGDVGPLLERGDDTYVVANAGDEVTLRFEGDELPILEEGWTRTWLIYTDGWVKDGDLNTATGQTVDPLPFRGASEYPYRAPEAFPADAEHRAFLDRYQTREVRPPFTTRWPDVRQGESGAASPGRTR